MNRRYLTLYNFDTILRLHPPVRRVLSRVQGLASPNRADSSVNLAVPLAASAAEPAATMPSNKTPPPVDAAVPPTTFAAVPEAMLSAMALSSSLVPHEEREESSSMAAYGMKPLLPGLGLRKENLLRTAVITTGTRAPIVQADKKRYCQCCGKEGYRFQKCSGCRWAYYCSLACQRTDWKEREHKRECDPDRQIPTGTKGFAH